MCVDDKELHGGELKYPSGDGTNNVKFLCLIQNNVLKENFMFPLSAWPQQKENGILFLIFETGKTEYYCYSRKLF